MNRLPSTEKLQRNYQLGKTQLDRVLASFNVAQSKLFEQYYHLRTTTSYWRLVCTDIGRCAMRTIKIKSINDFESACIKALESINHIDEIQSMGKIEVVERFGLNVYAIEKRKAITEYQIQALFINHLSDCDMNLIASEFNIKSGGRQRIDIVAEKDNELWLIEVKDGDTITDATNQVNDYKTLIEDNRLDVFSIMKPFVKTLREDFIVKTAVVYTKGKKGKNNIDKLWKYNKDSGTFEEE